jgi:hypothetical protein
MSVIKDSVFASANNGDEIQWGAENGSEYSFQVDRRGVNGLGITVVGSLTRFGEGQAHEIGENVAFQIQHDGSGPETEEIPRGYQNIDGEISSFPLRPMVDVVLIPASPEST